MFEFRLTKEQELIQKSIREFAQKEIAPLAASTDQNKEFPSEIIKKLADLGYLGLTFPEEFGGANADTTTLSIFMQEIAGVCGSTAMTLIAQLCTGSRPLVFYGTDEQKKKYIPDLIDGKKLCCLALTEPEAGSDAAAIKTNAIKDGNQYVLNGSKCWITNCGVADLYTVFARTRPPVKYRGDGVSAILVEKGTPGFKFGKIEDKLGIRGNPTGELIFDNCRVPEENLLGQEGEAFRNLMRVFNSTRLINSSNAIGMAQAALDHCIKYAKSRIQFDKPISAFQGIRWMLADMAIQIEAARLLVYRAAYNLDNGLPFRKEVSIAKVFANEMAIKVTNMALQIFGASGYSSEYPIERILRDARVWAIGGGTPQIQRNVIARELLK